LRRGGARHAEKSLAKARGFEPDPESIDKEQGCRRVCEVPWHRTPSVRIARRAVLRLRERQSPQVRSTILRALLPPRRLLFQAAQDDPFEVARYVAPDTLG